MRVVALASLLLVAAAGTPLSAAELTHGGIADWPYYGGDAGGSRYSPLTQIDRSNVAQLKIA
jgi:quinoprotein glucose dehydrogenase